MATAMEKRNSEHGGAIKRHAALRAETQRERERGTHTNTHTHTRDKTQLQPAVKLRVYPFLLFAAGRSILLQQDFIRWTRARDLRVSGKILETLLINGRDRYIMWLNSPRASVIEAEAGTERERATVHRTRWCQPEFSLCLRCY